VHLNRKSMRKLASLTALGAGAVTLPAENAEASVIYSGPIDAKVGIATGYANDYTSPLLPGGADFDFHLISSVSRTVNGGSVHVISLYAKGLGGPKGPFFERFQTNPPFPGSALKVVNAGVLWSSAAPLNNILLAIRYWSGIFAVKYGLSSFTNQYAMFRFNGCGSSPCYGWIDLSLSVTNFPGKGHNGSAGPNLDIMGFAYDDTGALVPAGYTGPNSIPEPSTFELTGLAALALGAEGLRRWRAARQA
jgi:hypothetical protein